MRLFKKFQIKRLDARTVFLTVLGLISASSIVYSFIVSPYVFTSNVVAPETSTSPVIYGEYEVVRVVDGDTIVVGVDGKNEKVRLIGVDTPESVHPDKQKNTEDGKRAAAYLKGLLDGKQVYLEYDVEKYDKYERTLAYVYLADGKTMVNKILLEQGYAKVMSIPPNVKYAGEFSQIIDISMGEEKREDVA